MASVSAAGTYDDYKLWNANYSRTFRIEKAKEFENLKRKDKKKLLEENRAKAKKKKQKQKNK